MRLLACLVAAGMFAFSATEARAETVAYGEAFDTLYRIDLPSHTATAVGQAGFFAGQRIGNISGLSEAPDGRLYAVVGGMNSLTRIDPTTGTASIVGSFGLNGQGDPQRNDALDLGMTFDCDGMLWLVSAYAGRVWTVNPSSGATTIVGPTGATLTGLVAHGDVLYGAGSRGDNKLYTIDKHTGAARAIGSYDTDRWINSISMSFDASGTLYAVLNYVPPQPGSTTVADWSDLATIDPVTGHMTIIGPITGPSDLRQVGMKGFSIGPPLCVNGAIQSVTLPVGTPPFLVLLGGLVVLAAGFSLRRRATR